MVMDWLDYYNKPVLRINGDEDKYKFQGVDKKGVYFENKETKAVYNLCAFDSCWWRRSGIREQQSYCNWGDLRDKIESSPLNSLSTLAYSYHKQEIDILHEYVVSRIWQSTPINLGSPIFDLNRLIVLDAAKKTGLNVPDFNIVTNTSNLKKIHSSKHSLVTKAISNGLYDVHDGKRFYTYTESIPDSFVDASEKDVALFPSLIMEQIEKAFEIRAFFLDNKVFSMALWSQENDESKVDYRINTPKVQIPYKLGNKIEQKLIRLFNKLNLNTGSADLIMTPKGECYFLEINPVGQFGMTSIPCNYNLEKLVAKYLIYGTIGQDNSEL